jgi:large subunit ribosomal protein L21e
MPHPRYQGKEGTVTATRGDSYEIGIMDGGKKKTLITNSAHLKKA